MRSLLASLIFLLERYIDKYLARVNPFEAVVCFFALFVLLVAAFRFSKIESFIMSLYGTLVLAITFLGRSIGSVHSSYEGLFTTYRSWLIEGKYWIAYEVIYNIALFVPLGIIIARKNHKFLHATICVFGCTFIIETIQLITGTGLFEICDLIDNTLGGLAGIGVYHIMHYLHMKKRLNI